MPPVADPAERARRGVLEVGALSLTLAAMALAGLTGHLVLFAVAFLVSLVVDAVLLVRVPELTRMLSRLDNGVTLRSLTRETLLLLSWSLAAAPGRRQLAVAVLALGVLHAGRGVYAVLMARGAREQRLRIRWRDLDVDGAACGPPDLVEPIRPVLAANAVRMLLHLDVLLLIGVVVTARGGPAQAVYAGAVAVVVCSAVAVVLAVRHRRDVVSRPSPAQSNARLLAALDAYAPEVVVYFSSAVTSTYALNVWLASIDRLRRRTVILLREAGHLANLEPTRTPILVLPRARDVEEFRVPSMKVALYPTTVIKNNHMLRLAGIRHVFVNHGDGDKSVTSSPLHRAFDEVWVAGQAAKDRYLRFGEGMCDAQLRIVGRPQLAGIRADGPPPSDRATTVLYAPTWEGNFDGVDYSSVEGMGPGLVRELLDAGPGVRLLFKPHPATGQRRPGAAAALAEIAEAIERAGGPHRLVPGGPDELHHAFNECDVLVADVSSVVADFLAARKPYVVTNPRSVPAERFAADFPSTRGGHVLSPGAPVRPVLEAIRTDDPLRERRERLATYFLGEPVADPVGRFVDEVDLAVERAAAWQRGRGVVERVAQ